MSIDPRQPLLTWFFQKFVPESDSPFAWMNPPAHPHKYVKAKKKITIQILRQCFDNDTRYTRIDGAYVPAICSVAVTPQSSTNHATMIAIDIDHAQIPAMIHILNDLHAQGLWAFVQLSHSPKHTGGHLYIPIDCPVTSSILKSTADQILRKYSHMIEGDTYPQNRDLRLPLMMHLHALDGPTRYPLLFANKEIIHTEDPYKALADLKHRWTENAYERVRLFADPQAKDQIPTVKKIPPRHPSQVQPENSKSIIRYFNATHPLEELLHTSLPIGKAITCPWHDDQYPSLATWQMSDGTHVCKCLSTQSDCPAASVPYWDAFNIYCHENQYTPQDAMMKIRKDHKLGKKRTMRIKDHPTKIQYTQEDVCAHQHLLQETRTALVQTLNIAANQPNTLTIIKGTPGLGKTHSAAQMALEQYAMGRQVAIVAPSHTIAQEEWQPRLNNRGFVWKSRLELCACYNPNYLKKLVDNHYTLPHCQPG